MSSKGAPKLTALNTSKVLLKPAQQVTYNFFKISLFDMIASNNFSNFSYVIAMNVTKFMLRPQLSTMSALWSAIRNSDIFITHEKGILKCSKNSKRHEKTMFSVGQDKNVYFTYEFIFKCFFFFFDEAFHLYCV